MLSANISGSGINPNPEVEPMTDEELLSALDWQWTYDNKRIFVNAARRIRELLSLQN
ncbi:MAG: hypothetical protein LBS02_17590 [Hungatella sp.]|jgi:hypothetical protein|nr:hypothetical protein [Hungatella sp.]